MKEEMLERILHLLERDSRLSPKEIAAMLSIDEAEVKKAIEYYERNSTILGYKTVIDWDKTDRQSVTAFIEVKVTPQKSEGFDKIAEQIYTFKEVQSVYLMSGSFDLTIVVEGPSLKDVANFVSERLATIDCVVGTATHFVLKKYKEYGVEFGNKRTDERSALKL